MLIISDTGDVVRSETVFAFTRTATPQGDALIAWAAGVPVNTALVVGSESRIKDGLSHIRQALMRGDELLDLSEVIGPRPVVSGKLTVPQVQIPTDLKPNGGR